MKIPSIPFAGGPTTSLDDLYPDYLLSESEKFKEDKAKLKEIFNYHESLAIPMIHAKKKQHVRRYKLAYGIINPEDFSLTEEDMQDYERELSILEGGNEVNKGIKLDNFPIIPNIINTLKHELRRKYHNFYPRLVDSESVNDIIKTKQSEIINYLVQSRLAQMDMSGTPEEQQAKMAEFEKLPEIQEYYSFRFKPEAVKALEAILERDELRFNMPELAEDVFEESLIQAERYVHVRDLGSDYKPELLLAQHCAHAKSPLEKCVSQSMWFHWIEFNNLQGIITKYGNLMTDEQIEKLKVYHSKSSLTVDDSSYVPHSTTNHVTKRNWHALNNIINGVDERDQYNLSHQYMLIPRKLATLTVRVRIDQTNFEDIYSNNIDPEEYKVIKKPKYKDGEEKTLDNLIEGEHLDNFYINEVWYGIKISKLFGKQINLEEDDLEEIWIKLEKIRYQGKPENQLFGTVIPVFGGFPNFREESYNKSIVDRCSGYQVYHDYLMNKIKELVITELMPFYIINQGITGPDSLDETWKDRPLLKFIHSGQEYGLTQAETDGALYLNGQPMAQLINTDRSAAIKTRIDLAMLFKNECYAQIGISPQFMGSIKPDETATGVLNGINRSEAQIQYLFTNHYELMKKVKLYMLELMQVNLAESNEPIDISFINTNAQDVLFKLSPEMLPLSKVIGLFLEDSIRGNEILERMKQYSIMDNTSGSDSYEKMLILTANSHTTLLDKLLEQRLKRESREDQLAQRQEKMQQESIKANQEAQLAQQEYESNRDRLFIQRDLLVAQIRALGNSRNPDANGNDMFDIIELMKLNGASQQFNSEMDLKKQQAELARTNSEASLSAKLKEIDLLSEKNHKDYLLKLKELDTRLKVSNNLLAVAEENKNSYETKAKKK